MNKTTIFHVQTPSRRPRHKRFNLISLPFLSYASSPLPYNALPIPHTFICQYPTPQPIKLHSSNPALSCGTQLSKHTSAFPNHHLTIHFPWWTTHHNLLCEPWPKFSQPLLENRVKSRCLRSTTDHHDT